MSCKIKKQHEPKWFRKETHMGFLVVGIILAIGFVVGYSIVQTMVFEETLKKKGKKGMSLAIRIVIGLFIAGVFALFGSIRSVPTGHTGIVTEFGRVEDYTLDSGLHFVAPWKSVVNMDNRTQIATITLSCFSSDIQEVQVVYSANYQISKADAQTLYRTIGMNYLETVMQPKIEESVKGVIAQYTAESLIENRGTLSSKTEEILRDKLAVYNIELVSSSIANIDFTDEFTNAVEAKQVAEQNKLRAQTEQAQQTLEAQAAAERLVIAAQADADAAILAAEADKQVQQINADAAEYAGQKEAAVLQQVGEKMDKYPYLKYYYYYQAWNGQLPTTMLGDGTDVMMDFTD